MSKMKMAKKDYNYMNEERLYDRLSELYEYIENFPNGAQTVAVKNEIEYLESMI